MHLYTENNMVITLGNQHPTYIHLHPLSISISTTRKVNVNIKLDAALDLVDEIKFW